MNIENIEKIEEAAELSKEDIPDRFPIIEDKGEYFLNDEGGPNLEEGKIIHYFLEVNFRQIKYNKFKLLKKIGNLNYVFILSESFGGYSLGFKTKEYEYAVVNLNKDEREALSRAMIAFIESITERYKDIEWMQASPADTPYSKEEIEECIDQILDSSKNNLTREQLSSDYKGYQVFNLYRELFGKDFREGINFRKSKAKSRSRLFRSVLRQNLPEWDIEPEFGGQDFILKRKK